MPKAEPWRIFVRHRALLFAIWFVFLIFTAVALPPSVSHSHSPSVFQRLLILADALCALVLAVSLGSYFVKGWQRVPLASNKREYGAWLAFETLVGVPFMVGCVLLAFACLWVVLMR